jgi:hypothetical protein
LTGDRHPEAAGWLTAADLVAAFGGAEDALGRIIDVFQAARALTWDRPPVTEQIARLRRFVRERLGRSSNGEGDDELPLDDARTLVARAHGYHSWDDLVKQVN